MPIDIVFETHSTSEDNERGIATGWLPGRLSALGRDQARDLGRRRRDDDIAAVLCSDLARAVETASIALSGSSIPLLLDWRLRECDYGDRNGTSAAALHRDLRRHLGEPHPGGESWQQAVERVGRMLSDLPPRWDGCRLLLIGHRATHWGLEVALSGASLEDLVEVPFHWRPGWLYRMP
ncbi:MAG TPA: histidine phosphatase family protein [Candidatus Dormibacteraeota bacterium]|jgi:broad specificity phosphatase PhoE|nr:histidine phosphatase family protein [Candidatus Dormibacteraeota bacterium]